MKKFQAKNNQTRLNPDDDDTSTSSTSNPKRGSSLTNNRLVPTVLTRPLINTNVNNRENRTLVARSQDSRNSFNDNNKGVNKHDFINTSGCNCPPGPAGAIGPRGISGLQGPPGQNGRDGLPGANGKDGINGTNGLPGAPGKDGINGTNGQNGLQGIQGIPGLKGDKGDKGDQGIQGLQGLKGDQGLQGIQGLKGDKGDQGIQGLQGLIGPTGPAGSSFGASGTLGNPYIFVLNSSPGPGSVTVLDGTTPSKIRVIKDKIPVGNDPRCIAVSPNGQFCYISNQADNTISTLDNASLSTSGFSLISGISLPDQIIFHPDGRKAYVSSLNNTSTASVYVIDTIRNSLLPTINPIGVNGQTIGMAISPDGLTLYVSVVTTLGAASIVPINTSTNIPGTAISVPGVINGLTITPDGSRLYGSAFANNQVYVISTSTNTVIATITTGIGQSIFSDPYSIAASPDGLYVYVVNRNTSTISIITVATNTAVMLPSAGTNPFGVAFLKESGRTSAYVVNYSSNTMNVLLESYQGPTFAAPLNTVAFTTPAIFTNPSFVATGYVVPQTNGLLAYAQFLQQGPQPPLFATSFFTFAGPDPVAPFPAGSITKIALSDGGHCFKLAHVGIYEVSYNTSINKDMSIYLAQGNAPVSSNITTYIPASNAGQYNGGAISTTILINITSPNTYIGLRVQNAFTAPGWQQEFAASSNGGTFDNTTISTTALSIKRIS